jgi:catechol 2,3-dioxygenase-like lactoylglutathione lyase family enzyme
MNITIKASFLPHTDAEASAAFYRDVLGFEVRMDVGQGRMRWITVGPAGQPDTAIVLTPPAVDPGINDDERSTILELMAKGSFGGIVLETPDVDAAFAEIEAKGADVVQEPIDQPYGLRDCAFRDPAGNMVRLQQSA